MNRNVWPKIKKFFNVLKNCLFIFLYALLFYLTLIQISNFINPTRTVDYLFFNFFEVASSSMEPGIKKSDKVILKRIHDRKTLQPGDIIYFETSDPSLQSIGIKRIIHRVVKNDKQNEEITTHGDNNEKIAPFERQIPYKDVIAEHFYTIPNQYIQKLNIIFWFGFIYMIIELFYKIIYVKNDPKNIIL
ncbi:signal peptidase I [Candidatus Phytoplasma phoenicium]|uniref:Signal peptidase I n=1 Tax=Candidatus Phytoplasma phoenicium TaxID=198422 RepID=A0A0L0ML20_9MOLU|nr:signal peptidase I [Candidatus Phytoplasma phoenicium]KND62689.1 Peptidase S24-like, putative integral membrane protein [Candidatus Phytoplasma phoenicium]